METDEEDARHVKYAVLDIENVREPWNGRLICVGWRDRAYTPEDILGEHSYVLDELADPTIGKVVFTKHDHRWLRLDGWDIAGPVLDVQSMAWAVDENTDLDLATVSRLYGGGVVKDERIVKRGGVPYFRLDDGTLVLLEDTADNPEWLAQVLTYNEQDLASTLATFEGLLRRLRFEGEDLDAYWENDVLPLTPVLLDMETAGLPVDVPAAHDLRVRLEAEMADLDNDLHDEAQLPDDFNLASSDQLGLFLYTREFGLKRRLPIDKAQRATLRDGGKCTGCGRVWDPADHAAANGGGPPYACCPECTHTRLPDGFTVERIGLKYVNGTQTLAGKGFKVHKWTDGCKGRGQHRHTLDTCKPATDAKTLRVHYGDDMWVQSYLQLAQRRTVVGTFLSTFEEVAHEGRLYGRFNQTGTATGRLSSSSPNLQNIPSRGWLGSAVRSLFVPQPGMVFIHGDYSQLEPRLMAHLSGDPVLLDIFLNGDDVYLRTAREIWREPVEASDPRRSVCKVYVLALGYGAYPKTLREQLAVAGHFLPLHEVEEHFEGLQRVYRVFFEWKESVVSDARTVGYVDTLSGHRRRIHFGRATTWRAVEGREGRQAANAKVQGSAADVVARTMVNLHEEFHPDPRIIAQVHDELLLEARRGVDLRNPNLLRRIEEIATREHGFDLRVPLVFKPRVIGSWAEGKD